MSDSIDQIGADIQKAGAAVTTAAQIAQEVAPIITVANPAIGAEVATAAIAATTVVAAAQAINQDRKTGLISKLFSSIKSLFGIK